LFEPPEELSQLSGDEVIHSFNDGSDFVSIYQSCLLTPNFIPEKEEIFAPLPCGFWIGIYLFYENWSTETFTGKGFEKSPENQG